MIFLKKLGRIVAAFLVSLLILIAGLALILLALALTQHKAQEPFTYGVTYRYPYAKALGLDWKQNYTSMLQDLNVKHIRIPVYWNEVEREQGKYDFSNVDFQMNEASKNGAKVILAIGRRVPGWPECHIPDWAQNIPMDQQQEHVQKEITEIVNRYKSAPALQYWQVENEPFLTQFGKCPEYDVAKYLDAEISLVRFLDPNHQVIVTDSGELSIWIRAANRADVFGSTLYRKVYADSFGRYVNYHWPAIFFRSKEGFVRLFHKDKPIINIELQAEPWTTKGITSTDFEEQAITFTKGSLTENVEFAHKSGFDTTYFWGVEYWYWAEKQGHPEFLQEARNYFKK
jgi:hypothetical protein